MASTRPSPRPPKPPKPEPPPRAALPAASLLDAEERRHLIADIAANGSDAVRLKALDMLESIDQRAGMATHIGPKPPMNDNEKVQRLSRLMMACGPHITKQAHKLAKAYWQEEATWTINYIGGDNAEEVNESPTPEAVEDDPTRPESEGPPDSEGDLE